jgi:hypothetical protein
VLRQILCFVFDLLTCVLCRNRKLEIYTRFLMLQAERSRARFPRSPLDFVTLSNPSSPGVDPDFNINGYEESS